LEGLAAPVFLQFYACHVAWQAGARLRSVDLHQAYVAWARGNGRPMLSIKDVRREMAEIGHAHRKSNLMFFADAALLDAARQPADAEAYLGTLCEREAASLASDRLGIILRQVDTLRDEIVQLRRQLRLGR
jgi:hypothetical protein